jgi:hypothetical protein
MSTQTKVGHTPGPWVWEPETGGAQDVLAPNEPKGHKLVAVVWGNTNIPANARLIAAAPDMLEALRSALSLIEAISDGRIAEVHGDIDDTGSLVCDAIAKATQ